MTSRERVIGSLSKSGYDRIPVKHEGTPEVNQALMEHFGLRNYEQLLRVVGDDFRYVEAPYVGPELRTFPDGSIEGYWGERYKYQPYEGGKYLEATHLPYAGIEKLADLDRSHFPSASWFDYSTIKQQCDAIREQGFAVCFGTPGDLDFINTISRARGMERVMLDLATENEVFLEILDARTRFYYELHERALQAAEGLIDIIHVGEDLGQQAGPMIGMESFERFFAARYGAHFDLAHRHGAKTMMHMCGCVEPFLNRLMELGLDIQDVVQPTTPNMDIAYLAAHYGDRLHFCGTMCVQTTLPFGSAADVAKEVERRLALFPQGGLFLGPTHAIQVGTPIENILTMYRTTGSLREPDEEILAIGGEADEVSDKPNLSKLF
jgi:uroporphyrinogen decarboxylase